MSRDLSSNAEAILLLTAPLIAGKIKRPVRPLTLREYRDLVRHLRELEWEPANLLDPGALKELNEAWPKLDVERVHRLLGRGFLLAQALERWSARAIWVVTRADPDYPRRLKRRLRENAPPVLYGCGDYAAMNAGGLAVVGSRRVNEELIRSTEDVGHLAAQSDIAIVSGGARGIDQAAVRGALEAGGRALNVLANGLKRAALNRGNRPALMDGRLVLVCPYDPAVRFLAGYAMQRNKFIYALSDAALVQNSDHGHGGTWAGATEQLHKFHFVPVYVRTSGEPCIALDALVERGARPWPNPQSAADMREIVLDDASRVAGSAQRDLFGSRTASGARAPVVREGEATAVHERTDPAPRAVAAAKRLLPVMSDEMARREVLTVLGLRSLGNLAREVSEAMPRGGLDRDDDSRNAEE